MRTLFVSALILALASIAWMIWVPSTQAPSPAAVDLYVTPPAIDDNVAWRVVTHRMVWKKGVEDLQKKLRSSKLEPKLLTRREDVDLHAFDDARIFPDRQQAQQAQRVWKQHGFAIDLQALAGGKFRIGLGRFYIMEYARTMEQQLIASELPYQYEKRTIKIPTMRFYFAPMLRPQAEILWKTLQSLGIGQPVIMQASEFNRRYFSGRQKAALKNGGHH